MYSSVSLCATSTKPWLVLHRHWRSTQQYCTPLPPSKSHISISTVSLVDVPLAQELCASLTGVEEGPTRHSNGCCLQLFDAQIANITERWAHITAHHIRIQVRINKVGIRISHFRATSCLQCSSCTSSDAFKGIKRPTDNLMQQPDLHG